jgi:hypothetical protein
MTEHHELVSGHVEGMRGEKEWIQRFGGRVRRKETSRKT